MQEDKLLPPSQENGRSGLPSPVYPTTATPVYPPDMMLYGPPKHLRDHLRVVLRRKWLVLVVLVTCLSISAVYTFRQIPLFQATTQIEIDLESARVLPYDNFDREAGSSYRVYDEYLQTQLKHISSRSLARRVVLAAGLDRLIEDYPEKATGPSAFFASLAGSDDREPSRPRTREEKIDLAIDRVLEGLETAPSKRSRVVDISYTCPDPQLASRVVNTLAREYLEYNFQNRYDATVRATEFLQKQLVDLKARVEQSEEAMVQYARKNNILNVSEKQDVVIQTLSDLNSTLTQARAERMDRESVYRTLSAATPEEFPQALRTPLIESLEENLLKAEQELARVTAQLGPGMPQVRQLESQLARTREQLRHQMQLAIDNARTQYETALSRERLLAKALDEQKTLANQLNESSIQYNILRREVDTNKQLYDGLLQRMKEAGVSAGLKSSNIQVVDAAEIPKAPVSPSWRRNLALAAMLGLMLGVGLAFFLKYLDNTVKTPEDVEDLVGLPALGIVPSLQSAGARYGYLPGALKQGAQSKALARQGAELASLNASSSLIAEAYRSLRTALLLSTPGSPPKRIMVTSPKAREGKTTTVCNLALSLAQSGKTVVIMDCDLHRPRIKKIFSQNGGGGMSEYLTGQMELDEIIQSSEVQNLCIVNAGTPPPNPCELLGSPRMLDAIDLLSETFDFVLIDTPPLMSVTDPLILAPLVDGVVLVTHGGKSPPEILDKARRSLEMVHSKVLGVVINNVNVHSGDYAYYYQDFYDYESYVKKEAP